MNQKLLTPAQWADFVKWPRLLNKSSEDGFVCAIANPYLFAEGYANYVLETLKPTIDTAIESARTHLGHHYGPAPTNDELGI